MMHKNLVPRSLILIVSLLVVLPIAALAQEASTDESQELDGTVISVEDGYVVIETESGRERLTVDDESILPDVEIVGETVYATYRDLDGEMHLTGISFDESFDTEIAESESNLDETQNEADAEESTQVASNDDQQAQQSDESAASSRELPSTASPLPLLALLGAASFGAGLLTRFRK